MDPLNNQQENQQENQQQDNQQDNHSPTPPTDDKNNDQDWKNQSDNRREEIARNKESAMQEERRKRKELEQKLEEIENNKKIEEWKYKDLYEELHSKYNETKTKAEQLEEFYNSYQAEQKEKLDTKLKSIPKNEIDFVNEIIEGKDISKQIKLVDQYLQRIGDKDFSSRPTENKNSQKKDNITTEYEQAKKEGNIAKMIQLKNQIES